MALREGEGRATAPPDAGGLRALLDPAASAAALEALLAGGGWLAVLLQQTEGGWRAVFVDDGASAFLGVPAGRHDGLRLDILEQAPADSSFVRALEAARSSGQAQLLDAVAGPSGRSWRVHVIPLPGEPPRLLALGRELEDEAGTSRRLEALVASMNAVWRTVELDELAETLVDQAARLLPGTVTSFTVAGAPGSNQLVIVAASEPWLRDLRLPMDGSVAGRVMRTGESLEIAAADAYNVELLITEGVSVLRGVPLPTMDQGEQDLKATGALVFLSRRPAGFSAQDREVMDQFAQLAALAHERARLLARARGAADDLQKAFAVALTLGAARSPSDVVNLLLENAVEALDAERATLSSIDPEGTLTIQATYARNGRELSWIGLTYSRELVRRQPTIRRAIEMRRPVISGRLHVDLSAPELQATLERTRHTLTVPLVHAGEVEALLVLSREQDEPFRDEAVGTAQLIGSAAMLALSNARLYQETEQARATSERLGAAVRLGVESALDVASELTLKDVVMRLVGRAAEVARADRCVLLSVADGIATVESSISHSAAAVVPTGSTLVVADHPLLVDAFERGTATQATRINTSVFTPEQREMVRGLGRFATVPLLFGGVPIGALNLSRYRDEAFSDAELMTLTQIGQIAALAVRNARLFEELESASRSKTDFLNLAAHELRTPISVIKGYLSLISDGSLGDLPISLVQPLSVIQEKAAELNRIVEDLLAAARVQAGSLTANLAEVDVADLARRAADRARPAVELAAGELRLRVPESPVSANLDPTHLERVLDNLLNNAVAYSAGPPVIELAVEVDGEGTRVLVSDRGLGIPGGQQERVFEQFVRLEDPERGYTPGTGLGLYISRGLARRWGGDVLLLESRPGSGSTFAVLLPRPGA